MNVNSTTLSALKYAFMVFFIVTLSFNSVLQAEEVIITDIILINGLAELVDINPDGEVLQRYLAIPDYFSSGRTHKRTLRESLAKTKLFGLSSKEEDFIETIVYSAPIECLQSLMMKESNVGVIQFEKDVFVEDLVSNSSEIENNVIQHQPSFSINYNQSKVKNPLIRQRTLISDRFKSVALSFSTTNRTSKAIIDV